MKEEKLLYSKYLKDSLLYYIEQIGSSIENLAQEINLGTEELNAIIDGKKGISREIAFKITNWKEFGISCPEFITEFYSFFNIPISILVPSVSKSKEEVLRNSGMFGWERKELDKLIKSNIDFDEIVQELSLIKSKAIAANADYLLMDGQKLILMKSEAPENKNSLERFSAKKTIMHSTFQDLINSIMPAIIQARELQKFPVVSEIFRKMEFAIRKAFESGQYCAYLKISELEKDLIQKLKMDAGKDKNNSKYWADRLEQEYAKQSAKMSEKTKKSTCYYAIAEKFEKAEKKEPPTHKTLREWWRKYYPQRF